MSVFNSESTRKYLQETFSVELEAAYKQERQKGYAEGLTQARASLNQKLGDANAELEQLQKSIVQANNSLSQVKNESKLAQDNSVIWNTLEESLLAFNTMLVEEKKLLEPYLVQHITEVFGSILSSKVLQGTLVEYALKQVTDNEQQMITVEMSEGTFKAKNGKCSQKVKPKINASLSDDEVIVCLKHQDIHVSTQGIKMRIKDNLRELIDAL